MRELKAEQKKGTRVDANTAAWKYRYANHAPGLGLGTWAIGGGNWANGKVRYIGVSNFNVQQLRRAEAIAPISSLQPPYSLIHPEVEKEILPYCQDQRIGVIVYSPMTSGLLTGRMSAERIASMPEDDWRKHAPDFQEPRLTRNLKLANLLQEVGFPHNRSSGEVAIAWVLRNPAVTGAIVGGRKPSQIDELIGASEFRLEDIELQQIDKFLQENLSV